MMQGQFPAGGFTQGIFHKPGCAQRAFVLRRQDQVIRPIQQQSSRFRKHPLSQFLREAVAGKKIADAAQQKFFCPVANRPVKPLLPSRCGRCLDRWRFGFHGHGAWSPKWMPWASGSSLE